MQTDGMNDELNWIEHQFYHFLTKLPIIIKAWNHLIGSETLISSHNVGGTVCLLWLPQIAKFMGPTWDPPGSCRPQMGPMLAPCWNLKSGVQTCRAHLLPSSIHLMHAVFPAVSVGTVKQSKSPSIHWGRDSWTYGIKMLYSEAARILCAVNEGKATVKTLALSSKYKVNYHIWLRQPFYSYFARLQQILLKFPIIAHDTCFCWHSPDQRISLPKWLGD